MIPVCASWDWWVWRDHGWQMRAPLCSGIYDDTDGQLERVTCENCHRILAEKVAEIIRRQFWWRRHWQRMS